MTFKTLEQRNSEKKKIKHTLQRIVGVAIPASILLYVAWGIPRAIRVDKKLEPLKKQFEYVAKTHSRSIERIPGFLDDQKVFEYGGALDKIISERDSICKANKTLYSGRWIVADDGAHTDGIPFCYNPF